jgi:predicted 3-demethylubiquinone-9 3-methyltransferase (glyoxalase superfamily)
MKLLIPLLCLLPLLPYPFQDDASMAAKSPQPQVTPFLWFEKDVDAAARLYVEAFEDSEVIEEVRWGPGAPAPEGSLMLVRIRLRGQELILFQGGPFRTPNETFSLMVLCEDQAEIDRTWAALLEGGGEPSQCGWLRDRFGFSWQIVPRELMAVWSSSDKAAAERVMAAMLQMGKLDLARLRAARDGR